MTDTSTAAASNSASKSLLARFFGILTSPRETYQDVVAHPKWLGMLALTSIAVALLVGGYLVTRVGQDAWLTQAQNSNAAFGRQMSDQQIEGMEKIAPYVGYFAAVQMLIGLPLISAIVAGLLFAVFNAALGGEASFKQVFAVVVHAGPIGLLSQAFSMPVNYARGTLTGAANLGVLVPMLDERSFLSHFLGTIDLFLVWQLIVLAIGLSVLYKRRTQPIATTLLVLYGVIGAAIAGYMSMRGGG
jgi:hypothetical protein